MSCTLKGPVKKLIFCCDVDCEAILILISFVCFYISLIHLTNWIAFFCYIILIPFVISMVLYFVGGLVLCLGVTTSTPGLINLFRWIMAVCLLSNVVYVVMLNFNQKCVHDNIKWAVTYPIYYHLLVFLEFLLMGLIPGINFLVTLYSTIYVTDYLSEINEY
ncbi:hypothetical protein RUM43_014375 [Polyplax serrata]|uniref:Uncharacterized protein n=1 Tax=Polyplax serrata TaxID=468196 RepID=A0AAN8PSS7_POLSC